MASVLHSDRFEAVLAAVGPHRAAALAAELGDRIEALLLAIERAAEAPDALIGRTHQLRGSASTLGMLALGAELERLELAVARQEGPWPEGRSGEVAQVRLAHAAAAQAAAAALAARKRGHAGDRTSR